MALSIIFTTYTRNGLKILQCEQTFILCETSFEKKLKRLNNNRVIEKDNIDKNFYEVFLNNDRRRYVAEEKLQQSKVESFYY